jgi:hypothetical protein
VANIWNVSLTAGGLAYITLGLYCLHAKRVILHPTRWRRPPTWRAYGWRYLLAGSFFVLVWAPGVAGVSGWARVGFGTIGAVCAVGAVAIDVWSDYVTWAAARKG